MTDIANPPVQLRPVMCATCSAPTGEMRERHSSLGRFGTCANCTIGAGARPWTHRDGDDNFVPAHALGAYRDEDDEDEEPEDERPRCGGCGAMEFTATAVVTSSWYGIDAEYETSSAYFSLYDNLRYGDTEVRVECDNCGSNVTNEISWEQD